MAQKLTVGFKDINGIGASTHFWVNDGVTALVSLQALANLSNAQIVSAFTTKKLDLTANNWTKAATAANNETVRTKAKIRMSGNDVGSVTNPKDYATVSIPAPVGTIINAFPNGDIAGALVTPFKNIVRSNADVSMTDIERVFYGRR